MPMSINVAPDKRPRLLYITSEDWFFENHFGHLARTAQAAHYDVHIACRVSGKPPLASADFRIHPQVFDRGKRNSFHIARSLPRLLAAFRKTDADIIHIIGLQSILIAAPLAALFTRAKIVLAPTGLGQFWIENRRRAPAIRAAIRLFLRRYRSPRFFYLFENEDDIVELGLENYSRLKIIGGAGVDENVFTPAPFPPMPPLRVAVVSRMLHSKGIIESAAAVWQARAQGHNIELDLWGAPDPANASSLSEDELRAISKDGVTWRGETANIPVVWKNTHAALLLSKREGLPRSLLEAASCGRPIIAGNVPGCRAFVRDGQEGLLVDPNDPHEAAHALIRLTEDENLRLTLGVNARTRVLSGFTQAQVANDILNFYGAALEGVTPPRAQPL